MVPIQVPAVRESEVGQGERLRKGEDPNPAGYIYGNNSSQCRKTYYLSEYEMTLFNKCLMRSCSNQEITDSRSSSLPIFHEFLCLMQICLVNFL